MFRVWSYNLALQKLPDLGFLVEHRRSQLLRKVDDTSLEMGVRVEGFVNHMRPDVIRYVVSLRWEPK